MIEPPRPRARLSDDGDQLEIAIPPPRRWYAVLLVVVWTAFWAFGLAMAAKQLLVPGRHEGHWFLAMWLVGWVVAGGSSVIYMGLYMMFGLQLVRIDGTTLAITRRAPVYTRVQRFDLTQIRDLRASPVASTIVGWGTGQYATDLSGLTGGHLAFDYGAKTYRFGAGVDEAEAKQLVARIVQRFPSLASAAL